MKLSEDRQIAAPPGTVWEALLDPAVLRECIPGCEALTGSAEEGFEARVTQKVGPVKATFRGTVTVTDMIPGLSCRLTGEGRGGAAGFARGGATVTLTATEEGTGLSYDVEANVGGKLAQLGSRVIDAFTRRLADQFFARFQEVVEARPDPRDLATPGTREDAPAEVPAAALAAAAPASAPKSWLRRIFG